MIRNKHDSFGMSSAYERTSWRDIGRKANARAAKAAKAESFWAAYWGWAHDPLGMGAQAGG